MRMTSSNRWLALGVIATAQFMVIMDTSIIGVALPDIQRALDFSQASLSWVFNAYVIAFGGLLLLGGRLSDLFGARRVFAWGWVVLVAGSSLAGLATNEPALLASRGLQGIGAALIAPSALTLLMMLFGHDPRELTRAMAIYGAAAPAGGTAGVFLGGALTQYADWRWVFLINIPIGLAALAATPRLLPAGHRQRGRLDLTGALLVTAGLGLAVLGIVRAPEVGWTAQTTLLELAGAIALLVAFVLVQARRAEPLLPLSLLCAPNLAAANLVMALLGAAWIPGWYFLNLYLQNVLGDGPFRAGASLLPMTIAIMILMIAVTGRLAARTGVKPPMVAGLLALTAGVALLGLTRANGSFLIDVLPASLIAATGMSLAYIPTLLAALSGARPEQGGLASGIVNTSYQIGSALGLAAMTAIATSRGASVSSDLERLTSGYHAAFVGAGVIAALGAVVAIAALRAPRGTPDAEVAARLQPQTASRGA